MSIKVSLFYWENALTVSHTEKLLLLALADWCNDEGFCFPSIPSVAKRCCLSDRGVQKVIDRLVAAGQLAIEKGNGMRIGSGSPTNRYHLIAYQASIGMPVRVNLVTNKGERIGSPIEADKGERCATRVNVVTDKGERIGSPDPSVDPSIDPSEEEITRASATPSSSSSSTSPATVIPPKPEPEPELVATPFAAPSENYTRIRQTYEQNFGLLTSILSERIKEALRTYPVDWVMMAMEKAVTAEKRRWDYVEGILRNWENEGFNGRAQRATATTIGGAIGHRKDSPKPRTYGEWDASDEEAAAILNGF